MTSEFGRPALVYRIISAEEWRAVQVQGVFLGSADDKRDGFIHLSTAEQVAGTHAKHYGGRAGLLLLAIDAAALGAALHYERARGSALFPHLYAPLPVAAVKSVRAIEAGALSFPDAQHPG